MFSQTAEYALRVVVFLATTGPKPVKNVTIAQATQVPPGYLYKVLQTLDSAGWVRAQRGMYGGFTLARPAAEISVLDIVQAVDPLPRIRTCPLRLEAHGVKLCPLHRRLDQAIAMVEEALGSCTIAELLAQPTTSIPLCAGPTAPAPTGA